MDKISSFRRLLARRLVQAAILAVPSTTVAIVGCGTNVSGGGGGASSSGDSVSGTGGANPCGASLTNPDSPYLGKGCFPWPEKDGGAGGMSGMSGMGGSGGMGGMGGSGGATADGGAPVCPPGASALPYFGAFMPVCGVASVPPGNEGTYDVKEGCCYEVCYAPCSGRPFVVEGSALHAPATRGEDGEWAAAGPSQPRTASLDPALRAELAEAWMRDGLLEHASIASFGRFALELLAVGAPADLVEGAHRAALDEVRHARLCLDLASAYAGETIAPARFPFGGRVEVESDLARVAARVAREGCIGETLAALQAAEQLASAEDPEVRAALAEIAADEARHAELAWRTVAWAIGAGGAPVRAAVEAVLADPGAPLVVDDATVSAGALAHGRLAPPQIRAALERGLAEVVRPAAAALLA